MLANTKFMFAGLSAQKELALAQPIVSDLGHFDPFPPHRPNAGYVIGKETVAWARGSGRDAPIPAVRGVAMELRDQPAEIRTTGRGAAVMSLCAPEC